MKLPKSWTTVTTLSKILAIAMFVALPFIGFYFGKKYQKSLTVPFTCQNCDKKVEEINNCIFQDKTAKLEGLYIDKENNFQLEIPKDWLGSVEEGDRGYNRSLNIQSPDFLAINEGYGLPVVGAKIYVTTLSIRYDNIEEFKKDDLGLGLEKGWIFNLRYLKVDGARAVQYEIAWESYSTVTNFIKNNKTYQISITYNPDQKSNKEYLETYSKMLSSFKSIEVK